MSATSTGASAGKARLYIYIDNSNLWIGKKKTYAQSQGFSDISDTRWRFDTGRLKTVLIRCSQLKAAGIETDIEIFLYRSTPPPIDTVWKAIEAHNVKVKTHPWSTWNNREKKVDADMIADSVEYSADCFYGKVKAEFMIVSGDPDLEAAADKITGRGFLV